MTIPRALTSSNNRLTVITSPSEHASARVGTMELETPRPFRFSLPDDDEDDDADEETEESLPFPAPFGTMEKTRY